MFVFATFGVHLLGGKLAACNDPEITNEVSFIQNHISNNFIRKCIQCFNHHFQEDKSMSRTHFFLRIILLSRMYLMVRFY